MRAKHPYLRKKQPSLFTGKLGQPQKIAVVETVYNPPKDATI